MTDSDNRLKDRPKGQNDRLMMAPEFDTKIDDKAQTSESCMADGGHVTTCAAQQDP